MSFYNPHGLALVKKGQPEPRAESWEFRPRPDGWWSAYESGRFIVTAETREGLIRSLLEINLADYLEDYTDPDNIPF